MTEAAQPVEGAGAAPAPEATQSAAPAEAAPAPQTTWTDSLEEQYRPMVERKAWKSPNDMAQSYYNLEKMMGVPPDQLIKLPKDGTFSPEEFTQVMQRLGAPKDAAEYELDFGSNSSDAFESWARNAFTQAGLTKQQAAAISQSWQQHTTDAMTNANEQYQASVQSEHKELQREWGKAYEQQLNQAKMAVKEFGVSPEAIDALEKTMGYAQTMRFFNNIGKALGEHEGVGGGDRGGNGGNGNLTPAQATAQWDELLADPEFAKSLLDGNHPGHKQAVARRSRLFQMMYPH